MHAHPPGVALAGSATLNRLELGNQRQDRTHKIQYEPGKIEECLLMMGVRCLPKHAAELVIDLDGMGHLVHGMQEGRHFNAYYDGYCYLPLYAFVAQLPIYVHNSRRLPSTALARMLHKPVEQMGGRGVRELENTELYDDPFYRPESDRL